MHIRFGYELIYSTPVPTHMILMLHTQLGRGQNYVVADHVQLSRSITVKYHTDGFGNTCTRLELPSGPTRITADALIEDPGRPEPVVLTAQEHPLRELPFEVMQFLLSSRYCDTEVLMAECRRCATSCISTSRSTIGMRDRRARPPRRSLNGAECVAISRTSPSRCVAA
jgi:hypothetical protein